MGDGGMGAFFTAEDASMESQVLIKVLPDVFANDPEILTMDAADERKEK